MVNRKERGAIIEDCLANNKPIPVEIFDRIPYSKLPKWMWRGRDSNGSLKGTNLPVWVDRKMMDRLSSCAGYFPDPSNLGVSKLKEYLSSPKKLDSSLIRKYELGTEEMNPWWYRVPNKYITRVS